MLQLLQDNGLTVKPRKCQLGMPECVYLGHTVGGGKVRPEFSKIEAVENFQTPMTKKQVRSFLGLTGYYRKFIPNYATIAHSLDWPKQERLETRVCRIVQEVEGNYLFIASTTEPRFWIILQTDASDHGVGAVLSQLDEEGKDHPVACFSRKFLPREEKYSTVEKECLGVQTFRVYLLLRVFTIQSDHRALEWLDRIKENNAQLTRWSLSLQPYQFKVEN